MDKHKKCALIKEQRRSFTLRFNRPGHSSWSVPMGQTSWKVTKSEFVTVLRGIKKEAVGVLL